MAEIQEETYRATCAESELSTLIQDMQHLCVAIYRVIGESLREDDDFYVIQTLAESIEARCQEANGELATLSEVVSTTLRSKRKAKEEKAEEPLL
jgi:hypothetical protein